MSRKFSFIVCLLVFGIFFAGGCGRSHRKIMENEIAYLSEMVRNQGHAFDVLIKKIDDVTWYERVGDIAYIDKVRLAGQPLSAFQQKKTGVPFIDEFMNNGLIFFSYVFIPLNLDENGKYPLIVFPHGGIHADMSLVNVHIIRELVSQGYIVVAPDYRGSTGYGRFIYEAIDYGGLENEDVLTSCRYMTENYRMVDTTRVGLMGWSHGGMITLMNLLQHPEAYACGYAGVPVSDVTYRLEYQDPSYTEYFTPDYHVGKSPAQDPEEYAKRSPVTYARLLERPLMITTCRNDDDVSWLEVQRMIDSLTFYKKDFRYKVYDSLPGAHLFERIDSREASEIRFNAYMFLNEYLKPPYPFTSHDQMRKAGYKYN